MIIIFLKYVNDGWRTRLINTLQELFAEYCEKILQAYAWQQKNYYLYQKINNSCITPRKIVQLNCALWGAKGLWFSHITVVVGFWKISK